MPFLSKDWRSPGEKWVRYGGGWEMRKTVWATHREGANTLTKSHISGVNECKGIDVSQYGKLSECDPRGDKGEKDCCREDSSEDSGCELCDELAMANAAKVEVGSWESAVFEFDHDQADDQRAPVEAMVVASRIRKKRFSLVAAAAPSPSPSSSDSLRRSNGNREQSKSAPRPPCPLSAPEKELFQPHCQVCEL